MAFLSESIYGVIDIWFITQLWIFSILFKLFFAAPALFPQDICLQFIISLLQLVFCLLNATFDVDTTKGNAIKDLPLSLSICKSICWFLILRSWCSRTAKSDDYSSQIWFDKSVFCISWRKLEPLNQNQMCSFCLFLNLRQSRGYGWKLLCQQASDMLKYPKGWN